MTDQFTASEIPLPASVDGERTILGAVLLDNNAFEVAAEKLQAEDFSLDSHRRIFLRMADLMNSQRAIDIVTLANALTQRKEIEAVGGVAYLASLTEGLPRRPVIGEYIRIVKDKSLLRKLMSTCSLAIARAADQPESALELLGDTMRNLDQIEDASLRGADLESVGQWLNQNDVFAERVPGIFTGIDEYDELTYGLHRGELTVFAGRTSTGKTSHCGTVAWQIARRGKCVAVFINEQQKQSFIGRMLCGRSGVSFKAYRRSQLDMIERIYIEDAVKEFKTLPIFWDQRSSMSVASIRAKAARLKRSGELDVILIDQLSRVSGEGIWQKGMRSDEVIGEKVSALKGMAVDLDVPVGLYHQLNRETTKNEESRPRLENLRGSGNIEEHADNVAMFYRPKPTELEAEILVLKQRDGAVGTAHCEFVGEVCLWRNKR
jgi:replicative DNA helicase